MITLRHINYFITAYEAKSFSRAAEQLFVSRQTISATIREMEKDLENEVFVKGTSPLQLTACGKYLYENGRKLQQQFDNLIFEAGHVREKKFAVSISSEILAISPKIKKGILTYLRQEPDTLVDLVESVSMDKAYELIRSGAVSCGFLFGTSKEFSECFSIPIEEYQVYAVVSQDHPLHACESISVEQLLDYPCLCFGTPKLFYPQIEECRKRLNKQRKFIVEPQVIRASQYMVRDQGVIMLSLIDRDIKADYAHLEMIPIEGLTYQLQLVGRLDCDNNQMCQDFGTRIAASL